MQNLNDLHTLYALSEKENEIIKKSIIEVYTAGRTKALP